MNGLERIMCAVNGKEADCQPYTMLLSLYGASLIKADTKEYYRSPELWFEGQEAAVEAFDPDILITPFSFPIEAEAFGSELVFLPKYAPNIKKPIINQLSQIQNLPTPDFEKLQSIRFFLETARLIGDKYKGTKAIASPIHAPTDIPALLMGIEMWVDTLLFHPKEVDEILQKTVEHFVRLGNEYFSLGATFLAVPVNFTSAMIITDKIFKNLIPYLTDAFQQLNGPVLIHNGGTKLLPFIDRFAQLPNVIGFLLEPTESFDKAREMIHKNQVLMGNADGPNFINFSQEKARESTLKILGNRKNDKHFIYATANADIPYDTPVETIKTIVDTIRNFKKY